MSRGGVGDSLCLDAGIVTQHGFGPWYRRYNRRAVWYQFGMYLILPYLSILRALLEYSWFWDSAGRKLPPHFLNIYHAAYIICVACHIWWRFPELIRTAEEDLVVPLAGNDIGKKALGRSKPHTNAGMTHSAVDFCVLIQYLQACSG